jgi:hypothetical protein
MRYLLLATATGAFLLMGAPAFAFGLSESDYDYLATQNFLRDSSILEGLSPKEQSRLHAIITDATTNSDPAKQAKNVGEAMSTFQEHQNWEKSHPGQLWDLPKR